MMFGSNKDQTLFLSLLRSKENKNSLSFIIDTNYTSGINTVDMIEVDSCNNAEQDLAIADCRRSQSGQPIT
jgi:hypothetical protein